MALNFKKHLPTFSKLFPRSEVAQSANNDDITTLKKLVKGQTQAVMEYAGVYLKAVKTRKDFFKQMDKIKTFYLVDTLVQSIADDSLTPDVTTGEVVQLTSPSEEINSHLIELQRRFDLDQIVNELMSDFLLQGEYILRNKVKKGEGLVEIYDDVDQTSVVSFYKHGYPDKFMVSAQTDIKVFPAYSFTHFAINRYKLRILARDEGINSQAQARTKLLIEEEGLPTYARIGRPLFYGVLSKLKELMLVEALVPASMLNDILRGSFIGVSIPANTVPAKAIEITKTYEQVFNKKMGIDRTNEEISVADILTAAGSLKALPIFGDKGQLEKLDVRGSNALENLQNSINDTREVICTSVGFPPELLFGGETKVEILKRYARYLRTLKAVQSSIANALTQLSMTHLVNSGMEQVRPKDINVIFRNEIVNIDELEKLEFQDAIISNVGNVIDFADRLLENEQLSTFINKDRLRDWTRKSLELLGRESNFIKSQEEVDQEPEPDGGDEDE